MKCFWLLWILTLCMVLILILLHFPFCFSFSMRSHGHDILQSLCSAVSQKRWKNYYSHYLLSIQSGFFPREYYFTHRLWGQKIYAAHCILFYFSPETGKGFCFSWRHSLTQDIHIIDLVAWIFMYIHTHFQKMFF